MNSFFDDNLFLYSNSAKSLYSAVKDLPIIDYHCHLDQTKIANDAKFLDIGELWLAGDHYKWRVMRLNGVDEYYITGGASYHDKFIKYAEILPNLIGNALYYWTHLELKQIFGINLPLNKDTAEENYRLANKKLANLSVQGLLKHFNVEFIATTDDPIDSLLDHKAYGNLTVSPTFRPDKLFNFDKDYIEKLGEVANVKINSFDTLLDALAIRLDYFVSKGCRMADHGLDTFTNVYPTKDEATKLFSRYTTLTDSEKEALKGYLLVWFSKEYAKRDISVQLHFAVTRNVNLKMSKICGPDSGYDVISELPSVQNVMKFLQQIDDEERPNTILYTLNDGNLASIACLNVSSIS